MNDKDKIKFLKEYKKLCLKHGLEIVGCGDCGSAWLQELGEENKKHSTLCWKDKFQEILFATDFEIKNKNNKRYNYKFL